MGIQIALLAGILFIGVLLAAELWRYWADDSIVTRGQLVKRLAVGLWLQGVLAMALVGDWVTAGMSVPRQMAYWGACLLFAIIPIFGAIHEAGVVARQYVRRREELFRRIVAPPRDRSRQG